MGRGVKVGSRLAVVAAHHHMTEGIGWDWMGWRHDLEEAKSKM